MIPTRLELVPVNTDVVKVTEWRMPSPGEPEVVHIDLKLTCDSGNSLHAAMHAGTVYYWWDHTVPWTELDRDRWQALTGESSE